MRSADGRDRNREENDDVKRLGDELEKCVGAQVSIPLATLLASEPENRGECNASRVLLRVACGAQKRLLI